VGGGSMKTYKIKVYHSNYGCDTGCCGHRVEVTKKEDEEWDNSKEWFIWSHPYEDFSEEINLKSWAIKEARKILKKKFPECLDSIDWNTLDISDVSAGEN
jgi:hypothetical protein